MTGIGVKETTFWTQEVKHITAESEKIINTKTYVNIRELAEFFGVKYRKTF